VEEVTGTRSLPAALESWLVSMVARDFFNPPPKAPWLTTGGGGRGKGEWDQGSAGGCWAMVVGVGKDLTVIHQSGRRQ
jgi:hypothetical protein